MQIDAAVRGFDPCVRCPLNAAGLIPLYDSHCDGGNRPPAALNWGIVHKFQLRETIPPTPTPLGVVGDAAAPLIVPEGLYAHVDCKSDIHCLCSASH